MRAFWLAAPVLAILAGCQDVPGRDPVMADPTATCERRLQEYDRAALFFSNGDWGRRQSMSPQIQQAAQAARQAGCVTGADVTDWLASQLPGIRGTLRGEQGAPIERTWLQVGVVGGISAEVQSRNFFSGLGYSVRSRGAPALGRRIFIGPFATAGGLAEAIEVSRRVGFIAPFPRRF
jgi:hypothetical protein